MTTSSDRPAVSFSLVLRRIGSALLAVLAVVLAVVVGVLLFLLGLNLSLPVAIALGAVALFAVAWLLSAVAQKAWRSPRSGPRRSLVRRRSPFIVAGALLAVVGVAAGVTILAPLPDEPTVEAGRPDPEFWDLDTGSRIAYWHFPAQNAEADATPIVYVHGGPGGYMKGDAIEFYQQIAETGHDVYLYDQAGGGLSSDLPLEDYTTERSVADIDAIREEIGADRIDLVGHSAGGYVVEAYVAAHGDRVEHVALVSPGGYDPDPAVAEAGEEETAELEKKVPGIGKTIAGGAPNFEEIPVRATVALALRQVMGPAAAESLLGQEGSKKVLAASTGGPLNLLANVTLAASFAASWDDTIAGLESGQTPTLHVRAQYDYLPWTQQLPYHEANSNLETVYIEGAFHSPYTDQPEAYFAALGAFFNDEPQPGGVYEGSRNPVLEDAVGVHDE